MRYGYVQAVLLHYNGVEYIKVPPYWRNETQVCLGKAGIVFMVSPIKLTELAFSPTMRSTKKPQTIPPSYEYC